MQDVSGPGEHLPRIAAALVRRRVEFVVIGGWAVEAQNFDLGYFTQDLDITPATAEDNLDRLSAALRDLGARVRAGDESFPFDHSGESLGRADMWNLTCDHGDFDVFFATPPVGGYEDLMRSAHEVAIEVDGGLFRIMCADLADIVASKIAADRPKDRRAAVVLRAQLEQQRHARRESDTPAAGGIDI